MVCCWNVHRVVCYVYHRRYLRYTYKIWSPIPAINKKAPNPIKEPPKFPILEANMRATPLTMQMAGTLLANTLKSKSTMAHYKMGEQECQLQRIRTVLLAATASVMG